jgi:ABC-2 type transport system ATP-binding protein
VIEVKELSKSYGPVQALKDATFKIAAGEIVGLLGPNGAGKTTLIKILMGYLQPDSGTALINGVDVMADPQKVQAGIGYLPENAPLYPELNVQSYLKMMAELRQIPEESRRARISDAVHAVGLEDYLTRPIGQLSKGFRQRVGLAQAILHQPPLLILDEPTVGLDPTQIVEIRRLIKRLAKHSTVLFSTHVLPEVEALCDRAIILMHSEVKADARLVDLANTANAILVLDTDVAGAAKALAELKDVHRVEPFRTPEKNPAFRIIGKENADLTPAVFRLAAEQNWPLRELRRDVRKLETVFNDLTIAA